MMQRNYKSMNNLDYHKKQLKYNMTSLLASIKEEYPDDIEPNLSNPKYSHILEASPFNPKALGELAETLGISNKAITLELWDDLQNGWCPVDASSPLWNQAIDTPRGRMVQFTRSATPITNSGEYDLEGASKDRRVGTEFIYCFGERLSTALGLMATEDPSVELRFKNLCMDVFQEHIVPEMTKLTRIRKGADGVELECAAEILVVPFMHIENRAEAPFFHFHVDYMNVARGYDGTLYSACTDELGANAAALDALFMSKMKEKLEKEFGFAFEAVKHEQDLENEFLEDHERKTVSFDLPQSIIPKEVLAWRAEREEEIKEALKQIRMEGKAQGYNAEELARLESRDEKTELTPAQLHAKWASVYDAAGWTVEKLQQSLEAYKQAPKAEVKLPTNDDIEETFTRHHKDVAFTEYQYLAHIQKQLLPYMPSEQAEREAVRTFEGNCLLSMSKAQMDYFNPFLEDSITDPTEYQSMQLRFHHEAKFILRSTKEKEEYCQSSLKAREHEMQFRFDPNDVQQFILNYEAEETRTKGKPFHFSKGQREAIKASLSAPGAVSNIAGRAGSGKSTALHAVRQYYVEHGFQVIGTSTSSTATKGLAESTCMKEGEFSNSTKLIKDLNSGKRKLTNKTVIFWDEAGMADSATYYNLVKHANEAGAKIILVGEKEQLASVGAGGLFSRMNQDFVTTPLKEINRQKDSWQRDMVEDFASGRSQKAIRSLYNNGKVIVTKKEKERLIQIVDDFVNVTHPKEMEAVQTGKQAITFINKAGVEQTVALDKLQLAGKTYEGNDLQTLLNSGTNRFTKDALSKALGVEIDQVKKVEPESVQKPKAIAAKEKVIVASTNDDVDMINEAVREKLKGMGKLPQEEITIKCSDRQERAFSVGDRVVFTKNQRTDDALAKKVNNAETGEVVSIINNLKGKPKALKLKMDDGKEAYLDISKTHAVKHAYALTVHKSQGQTKDAAFFWVNSNGNNLHQAYVACSRHRHDLRMYLSEAMVRTMEDKMDGKQPTASMVKVAEWVAKEKKIELAPETLKRFKNTRAFLDKHWKGVTGQEPHPLDRFTSIFEAMAKTNFKKTSFDYELLDGKAKNTYESIKRAIVERTRQSIKLPQPLPDAIKAQMASQNQIVHAQQITIQNPKPKQTTGIRI